MWLVACFAFRFPLCPFLCSFRPALVLLSCLAFLALWLVFWVLVGLLALFPFGRYQIRKRGAFSASLPRLVVSVGCYAIAVFFTLLSIVLIR